MKSRFPLGSSALAVVLCAIAAGSVSCRKPKEGGTAAPNVASRPVGTVDVSLTANNIGSLPGAFYQNQAASPIHWQPWTKETLGLAKAANRLIFAVVALPQQMGFQKVLSSLAADEKRVSEINSNYVPVLIDGDASREMGLLTADLCVEIKRGLQLPLFLWMSPEGNPVAWIPVDRNANVEELFAHSHTMVSRMWADDSSYVEKNSAMDNVNRRERFALRKNSKVMSQEPGPDSVRALRQLTSLYDPVSRNFDGTGGLFPAGALDLLATAAVHPGLSPEVRAKCLDTTRELLADLLPSAMFDPLEGGLFISRRGDSWALPSFSKNCATQARAAVALINAHRATGNAVALEKALDLIAFAEAAYQTPEGLFPIGVSEETPAAAWLWSEEDVEKALSPEDAAWWIKATGMKGLGNLPSESDPRREFFRSNSLGLAKSVPELAAEMGRTVEAFTPKFKAVREKLLSIRNGRIGTQTRDTASHAPTTLRMVSAYAAAFGATGNMKYREKAVSLLEKSRVAFSDGPRLRVFSKDAPESVGEGRAFLYSLALQAALDVSVITSDESWLAWSEDLASTAAELFTSAEFLKECPDDAKILDLPVTDLVMLFDDSTAGLISFAECRLAERQRPLATSFSQLATPLPTYAAERPILHTDLLQATIAREFKVTVVTGPDLSPEMKLATERISPRMVQKRPAKSRDEVPAGAAMVILSGGQTRVVSTPAALEEALLPLPEKS
ncbi:thioredoxin domain-containing protein [Luteolibacter yonseiensis]|uniref:Thioredoxin domain-containing protein n=1 Tax=Luteolibacter yonseiensis TaxID=1144680 RepID=A0A934R6I7_9BACT|nr:DUF255 domain-containing protein [Luteolibacter yonseiensis]MBK1817874.1 thioredoxin domain-containing protein [Luteolibacter yonseiensis]